MIVPTTPQATGGQAAGFTLTVKPEVFKKLLKQHPPDVIIHAMAKIFKPKHHYVMYYKGFTIHTKAKETLYLPKEVEVIEAKNFYVNSAYVQSTV